PGLIGPGGAPLTRLMMSQRTCWAPPDAVEGRATETTAWRQGPTPCRAARIVDGFACRLLSGEGVSRALLEPLADGDLPGRDRLRGQVVVAVARRRVARDTVECADHGQLQLADSWASGVQHHLERHVLEHDAVTQVDGCRAGDGDRVGA